MIGTYSFINCSCFVPDNQFTVFDITQVKGEYNLTWEILPHNIN